LATTATSAELHEDVVAGSTVAALIICEVLLFVSLPPTAVAVSDAIATLGWVVTRMSLPGAALSTTTLGAVADTSAPLSLTIEAVGFCEFFTSECADVFIVAVVLAFSRSSISDFSIIGDETTTGTELTMALVDATLVAGATAAAALAELLSVATAAFFVKFAVSDFVEVPSTVRLLSA